MYIVIGTRPDGTEARLEYATMAEALDRIRNLAEADEMEVQLGNGLEAMFVRYALVVPDVVRCFLPPEIPPPQQPPRLRLVE